MDGPGVTVNGVFILVPDRVYRLADGRWGTEYEWCAERVKTLEARIRFLEEEVELVRHQMDTADGRPW